MTPVANYANSKGVMVGLSDTIISGSPDLARASKNAPAQAVSPVVNEVSSGNVFSAVDKFFNLGDPNRLDAYFSLSDKDKEKFVQIVAKLLKEQYMGYEILEVNGQPEKHFIDCEIGDKRLYGAKIYNKNGEYDYIA